ncbi:hypothetical protein FOCC_FOCC007626 [Frankliniella occidentalis]|nr:hypothetical protein FOCC_FOCC007626 [Frankliniella occidentalis]
MSQGRDYHPLNGHVRHVTVIRRDVALGRACQPRGMPGRPGHLRHDHALAAVLAARGPRGAGTLLGGRLCCGRAAVLLGGAVAQPVARVGALGAGALQRGGPGAAGRGVRAGLARVGVPRRRPPRRRPGRLGARGRPHGRRGGLRERVAAVAPTAGRRRLAGRGRVRRGQSDAPEEAGRGRGGWRQATAAPQQGDGRVTKASSWRQQTSLFFRDSYCTSYWQL